VRQQLEIAAGAPLKYAQEDITAKGHAIECRIYAEDPLSDFMPSPGKIRYVKEPRGPGIRNDSGIYSGYTVPMDYDPILSKLIVHAGERTGCIRRMIRALRDYVVLGVLTPIPFLRDILLSDAFNRGETYTDFIDIHFPDWKPAVLNTDLAALACALDSLDGGRIRPATAKTDEEASSPWRTLGNYRP
jgi:acetyl-CoA carboxylase, biotin carboxylase subunit